MAIAFLYILWVAIAVYIAIGMYLAGHGRQ